MGLLLLLVVVLTLPGSDAKKKLKKNGISSSPQSLEQVAQQSLEAVAGLLPPKSNRNSIKLVDANFTTFVHDRPRLYHAAIFLTASPKKYQCFACKSVLKIFKESARHYNENYDFMSSSQEKRLAFFVLDLDSSRGVFTSMNIETVPRLYILPPVGVDDAKQSISKYEIPIDTIMDGVPSLLSEINKLTDIDIRVKIDAVPVLTLLCTLSLLLAYVWSLAAKNLETAKYWYRSPTIWMLFSYLFFAVGVSGSIYCIIRSAPAYGAGRGGEIEIFSDGNREQYLLEGLAVVMFVLFTAFAAVLVYYSTKIRFSPLKHCSVIAALSVLIVMLLQVWYTYVGKTVWYSLKDTLPEKLSSYLFSSVKKSSSLPKRLLRMSEIWLNDFNFAGEDDWDRLKKKFKTLITDYVLRSIGIASEVPAK